MKLRWFACLLFCSAAIIPVNAQTSAAAGAKSPTPLEQTLIANSKAMADAYKQKDVEYFKRTVADDFVGVGSDSQLYDRGDVLENVRMGDVQEYRPYNTKVLPLNDGAAVVTYDCIIRMTLYDDPIPRYQHISSVWVKQGEQWRLKFEQATPAQ